MDSGLITEPSAESCKDSVSFFEKSITVVVASVACCGFAFEYRGCRINKGESTSPVEMHWQRMFGDDHGLAR